MNEEKLTFQDIVDKAWETAYVTAESVTGKGVSEETRVYIAQTIFATLLNDYYAQMRAAQIAQKATKSPLKP